MQLFVAQLINGLATGSLYALVVVGLDLLFLVKGVYHWAFPHTAILSAFVCWLILRATHSNLPVAIVSTLVVATALVVVTEPFFRPLVRRGAFVETMIMSLGLSIIINEVITRYINHGSPVQFSGAIVGGGAWVNIGLISFSLAHIYTILGTVAVVVGLMYFLFHHKQGRAFRAIAHDPQAARLLGIPLNKSGVLSFAIAGVLAGMTAIFSIMTIGSATNTLADLLAPKAFIFALLAGMGNLKGGVIMALIFGVIEALVGGYMPGNWTDVVVYGTIMLVIIMRPTGIFKTRV